MLSADNDMCQGTLSGVNDRDELDLLILAGGHIERFDPVEISSRSRPDGGFVVK
jgi:hypothetical protein